MTDSVKKGRPKGSRNKPRAAAETVRSRCRACGSTERKPYTQTREQEHGGVDREGRPYTHIIRRWTSCADCGQARIDTSYENRVGGGARD